MIPVSLQLYSLRDDTAKDFAATIAAVAKMGYVGVETAGTGNLSVKEAQKVVRDSGLKVSGMHAGIAVLDGKFDELVAEAKGWGTTNVILPHIGKENFASVAAVTALGEKLAVLGAKLRKEGLSFFYHNHDQEMVTLEGRLAFEWLLDPVAPRDLGAELDVFWAMVAGVDPVHAIARFGSRARLLHLKDGNGRKQTELGKGQIDFPAIYKFVEANNLTEWMVVEQEEYNYAPLESVRHCLEYLRSIGKA